MSLSERSQHEKAVWFQLYDILEKGKNYRKSKASMVAMGSFGGWSSVE